MDYIKYGKEKRYDRFPELLNVHVQRMIDAHERAASYLSNVMLDSGIAKFENFLGAELAKEIEAEILDSTVKDGRKTHTLLVNRSGPSFRAKEKLWSVVKGFYHERMTERVERVFSDQTYLQHIKNEPDDGDDQKVFHSDTFFPCVKFWYFPAKVEINEGPFWYVPYSAKLTPELVKWHEDRVAELKDGRASAWRGTGHREGSFRIGQQEIRSLGLMEAPVCVEADTLVVANVFGFHKRGDVDKPTHRVSIHGSIRLSPF